MNKNLKKIKPYLLLLPLTLLLGSVFVVGLVEGILQSLGHFEVAGLFGFQLKYYTEVFQDKEIIESLCYSLYISICSGWIAVIVGTLLALFLSHHQTAFPVLQLIKLPLVVPHMVVVLMMVNLLDQTGWIARIMVLAKWIPDSTSFISLFYNRSGVGMILVYLWKEIPFVALTCYSVLHRMGDRLYDAARNLGAKPIQAFWYITLPLILPAIFSSFVIVFAYAFGSYEVPYLLGATTPKALAVRSFIEYSHPDFQHRPYAMVLMVLMFVIVFILTVIYKLLYDHIRKG